VTNLELVKTTENGKARTIASLMENSNSKNPYQKYHLPQQDTASVSLMKNTKMASINRKMGKANTTAIATTAIGETMAIGETTAMTMDIARGHKFSSTERYHLQLMATHTGRYLHADTPTSPSLSQYGHNLSRWWRRI
jgi:hypothetical protein